MWGATGVARTQQQCFPCALWQVFDLPGLGCLEFVSMFTDVLKRPVGLVTNAS